MSEQHEAVAAPEPVAPPVVAPEPAAVVNAPAPAPVEPAPTPEPAPQPAPEAPAPEAPSEPAPAEPALKPHTEEKSLLTSTEEAKPPETEAKPDEKPAETPVPVEEIKYDLKFPEGVQISREQLEPFENFAKEQKFTPEVAQRLADFHTAALQAKAAADVQLWHDQFGETRRGWRNEVLSDPEVGGAGFKTSQAAAMRMIQMFVPDEQRPAFEQMLDVTGAGDHPALMRFMVNLEKKFAEPAPVAAPTPRTPIPGASGAPESGKRINYTHPRGRASGTG